MTTITESDVPRVAAAIRVAGELFEVHGGLMLTLTDDWRAGAKAANLDPDTGGNRWEDCTTPPAACCPHAKPADPTGEAAIAQARADMADQLQTRLARIVGDAQWIRDCAHVLAPIVLPSSVNEKQDMWCNNCLRTGLANPRHRGTECRECYDFRVLWQVPRPVSLIRDRHLGLTMTDKRVKAALAADGVILKTVAGVTKAIRGARGTGKPNQNMKRKKAS